MNKGKINFAIPIDRKSTTMFDERLCGKRIKLIHTDDPNSRLKEGDMGTVKCTFLNLNKVVINVQWDSGNNCLSKLSVLISCSRINLVYSICYSILLCGIISWCVNWISSDIKESHPA